MRITYSLATPAGLVLGLFITAQASPLVYVDMTASTTGSPGTYTNSLTNIAAGTTLYYKLSLVSAPTTATNSHTSAQPNGTTDSANSVGVFSFTDNAGGTFDSFVTTGSPPQGGQGIQSPWYGGAGGGATLSVSQSLVTVRAIDSPGQFANYDTTSSLVVAGEITTSSSGAAEVVSGAYVSGTGGFKIGGTSVADQAAYESGSDPLVGYMALYIDATPEPASLGLLGLSGLALMRRRRTLRSCVVQM